MVETEGPKLGCVLEQTAWLRFAYHALEARGFERIGQSKQGWSASREGLPQ